MSSPFDPPTTAAGADAAPSGTDHQVGPQEDAPDLEAGTGTNGSSAADVSGSGRHEVSKPGKDKNRKYRVPLPHGVPLPVPEHESLATYVQRARNVSVFSIAFTLLCAIVGLAFAWSTNSSALLGYGLESLVDVWSSILVLWRFWDDPDGEGSYFETTQRRERRASVGIAVTFVVIGYITCWQAIAHLVERQEPTKSEILLAIAGTSVIILTWSFAIKWSLSKVLKSSALRKDAITSGAVAGMAATMLVSTAVYKSHPEVWWLDAAVALIVSFLFSLLGIKTLITHKWWRKDFWKDEHVPSGEGTRAQTIMRMPFSSPRHADGNPADSTAVGSAVSRYMHEVQMSAPDITGDATAGDQPPSNGTNDTAIGSTNHQHG